LATQDDGGAEHTLELFWLSYVLHKQAEGLAESGRTGSAVMPVLPVDSGDDQRVVHRDEPMVDCGITRPVAQVALKTD